MMVELLLTPATGIAAALGFLIGTLTRTAWSASHLGRNHDGPAHSH